MFNALVCWSLLLLSIVLSLFHTMILAKITHMWPNMYEMMLKYAFFLVLGCSFLFIGCGYGILAIYNWQSFAQQQIAFGYISISILAIINLFTEKDIWLETIIISTVWLWGIAVFNNYPWILNDSLTYASWGMFFWHIFAPCIMILLYFLNTYTNNFSKILVEE